MDDATKLADLEAELAPLQAAEKAAYEEYAQAQAKTADVAAQIAALVD